MLLSVDLGDNIFSGPGAMAKLEGLVAARRRVLLFVDRDAYPLCGAARFVEPLEEKYDIHLFSYSGKALPIEDVEMVYRQVREVEDADLVVGIGGGTVIDLAKIISIAYSNHCHLAEEVLDNKSLANKLDLVFVPTTAGTGSEATSFAVVYRDKVKISVLHPSLVPGNTILDPELLVSLPKPILNATVLDALAQAVESAWAVGASDQSRLYSREAIKLILGSIYQPHSVERLDALLMGSHLAGRAINISKTTLSHSISYPLTAHFGIAHGVAVFLSLPRVAELNYNAQASELQPKMDPQHLNESFELIFESFSVTGIAALIKKLDEILSVLEIKKGLRFYGIKPGDLGSLADNALTKGRSDNNPRKVERDEVLALLEAIY